MLGGGAPLLKRIQHYLHLGFSFVVNIPRSFSDASHRLEFSLGVRVKFGLGTHPVIEQ